MSRRRVTLGHYAPEQLPLEAAPKANLRAGGSPEQAAKAAVSRRAKPSAVPGHVKLTLTLDLKRGLAERLSARAIREGKNLEAVVLEILEAEMK